MSRVFTSTYHDTEDRRLARVGMVLRRRVENGKSTWELELPDAPGEVAFSAAGGPSEPPELMTDLLLAVVRDRRLEPVATLQARRSELPDGAVHDQVELLEGHRVLSRFDADGEGAIPRVPGIEQPPHRAPRDDRPVGRVQAMLQRQYHEILAYDPGVRLGDDPEAVHKSRVAVRRSRAALRTARPLLHREWADELRAELAWLGRALGDVRDLDIVLAQLRKESEALPADDLEAVQPALAAVEAERAMAREQLLETLRSERYLELLQALERAATAVPVSGREEPLAQLARAEYERFERALGRLDGKPADDALHRVRVHAKRARYAAELAGTKRTRRVAARARGVQDVLGAHQDAVVAAERIRLAAQGRGPAAAIAAGRLVEREAARRSEARARFPKARKKLERAARKAYA